MTLAGRGRVARLRAAMRSWILILFVCLLPMQWSLASAGSVCGHETNCSAHFGHHEHKHATTSQDEDSAPGGAASGGSHPDCQTCHAAGLAVARNADATLPGSTAGALAVWTPVAWADPPLADFLRPPAPILL